MKQRKNEPEQPKLPENYHSDEAFENRTTAQEQRPTEKYALIRQLIEEGWPRD